MEAKDKAWELVDKFEGQESDYYTSSGCDLEIDNSLAKKCALICVDEILCEDTFTLLSDMRKYWKEVKQEINLLS